MLLALPLTVGAGAVFITLIRYRVLYCKPAGTVVLMVTPEMANLFEPTILIVEPRVVVPEAKLPLGLLN